MHSNLLCVLQSGCLRTSSLPCFASLFATGSSIEEAADSAANFAGGLDMEELLYRTGAESKGGALAPFMDFVQSYGAGTANIAQVVLLYVALFGLLATAIGLVLYGNNPNKRAEQTSGLGYKVAGIILGFGSTAAILFLAGIGSNIFTIS